MTVAAFCDIVIITTSDAVIHWQRAVDLEKTGVETYVVYRRRRDPDYHAKSSTLEFFAAKVPKADWQGIRKEDIEPAQEYYSDDIIVDFDLLDRDAYEEKVCGGAHSDLPDAAFPVLVIVKSLD